jgi:NhaP-type Na+/H+ or K+/H+ antiporter
MKSEADMNKFLMRAPIVHYAGGVVLLTVAFTAFGGMLMGVPLGVLSVYLKRRQLRKAAADTSFTLDQDLVR